MDYVFKILLPLLILALLLNHFKKDKENALPYKEIDCILTPAEYNFYKTLLPACDEKYYIAMKIRLGDILTLPNVKDRHIFWAKVQSKHIDFVLCDKVSLKPLIAIELDDSSHQRKDRMERDIFVDKVLHSANIKIVRVPVRRNYDVKLIKEKIVV